jgi:hypothetical protein
MLNRNMSSTVALKTPAGAKSSAALIKAVRLIHMYLGVFLAPSILFFAVTGALQSFSLHESHSANYTPPSWLVHLSQMHKNQTLEVPVKKPAPPNALQAAPAKPPAPKPVGPPAKDIHAPSPMKFFFLFVALGLTVSTVLGLYMSYKFNRNRAAVNGTLLAGIIIPVAIAIIFP